MPNNYRTIRSIWINSHLITALCHPGGRFQRRICGNHCRINKGAAHLRMSAHPLSSEHPHGGDHPQAVGNVNACSAAGDRPTAHRAVAEHLAGRHSQVDRHILELFHVKLTRPAILSSSFFRRAKLVCKLNFRHASITTICLTSFAFLCFAINRSSIQFINTFSTAYWLLFTVQRWLSRQRWSVKSVFASES